jgi:sugar phosphate isomerase/epimerase
VKECVPKAKAVGVKMGLENHGGFSSNVDAVERMVKAVGSEFFGTCPDWGNFPVDDRYPALAKVYALAVHSHVKSYNFDEKGFETRLDFARIVKIIKDSGYDGILSIEFEGTGDGYDGVTKTQALLKRYL